MPKTNNYTAVFEDGTFFQGVWGGNVSSYRFHLENRGYRPMLILQRVRPLYARKGAELIQLDGG